MEKLTEKINAFNVTKSTKNMLLQIAEEEQLQIQQICRRLLMTAIKDYQIKVETKIKQYK